MRAAAAPDCARRCGAALTHWAVPSPLRRPRPSTRLGVVSARRPAVDTSQQPGDPAEQLAAAAAAARPQQQQQQDPPGGLIELLRSLQTEASMTRVLGDSSSSSSSDLVPVWLTAAELQQLLRAAGSSGACIGQAAGGAVSFRRASAGASSSGRRGALLQLRSALEQRVQEAEAAAPAAAAAGAPRGFTLWLAHEGRAIEFDPLGDASVVPGASEDPGAAYAPVSTPCLPDWRVAAAMQRTPAASWDHDDVVPPQEEQQHDQQEVLQLQVSAVEGPVAAVADTQQLPAPAEAAVAAAASAAVPALEAGGEGTAPAASEQHAGNKQAVTFRVKCPTAFGQRLWLVGDHASLGGWDTARWVKMHWSEGDVWAATVELDGPAGSIISYKAVLRNGDAGELQWTAGSSWKLPLDGSGSKEVFHKFQK